MTVVDALFIGWLTFIVGFVIAWSRFRARVRDLAGVDEDAYVNGMVDDSAEPDVRHTYPRHGPTPGAPSRWRSSPAI